MNSLRAPLGMLILAGVAICSTQVSTGRWLPSGLRVAGPLKVDSSRTGSNVEIGKAEAAFRVEQRDPSGALVWHLTGARVSSDSDLITHTVAEPRFRLQRDGVTAGFSARSARVTVPEEDPRGDERRFIRVDLVGDVQLSGSRAATEADSAVQTSLRGEALTLWIDRATDAQRKPDGARFRTDASVAIVFSGAGGSGPLKMNARQAEGTLVPLDLTLQGPVSFEGVVGGAQTAWIVSGIAERRIRVRGQGEGPPRGGLPTPHELSVHAEDLSFEAASPDQRWRGHASSLEALLDPAADDATSALHEVVLSGGVELRPIGAADPEAGVTAKTLRWSSDGPHGTLRSDGLDGLLNLETGRRAAPWKLKANTVEASVLRAALAQRPFVWRDALISADLRGAVSVERRGEAKRRRAVAAEHVNYQANPAVVSAVGGSSAPVTVGLGRSTIRAASARYALDSERLDASGRLQLVTRVSGRSLNTDEEEITISASADRGWAILSSDPERWKAHQRTRRALKTAGRPDWYPPEPIGSLELNGRGKRRVVVRGPQGARAEADCIAYDAASGQGRLVADEGATVLLESEGRRLVARQVELQRDRPDANSPADPKPTTISATGEVNVRGELPKEPGSHLELSCGAFRCELNDLAAGRPPTVGPFSAEQGVRLLIVTPDTSEDRRVGLSAEALSGDGNVALGEGRTGVRCTLDGRWDANVTLPKKGPARVSGGSLEAVIDLEAARAKSQPGESEVDLLRRSLHSLRIAGGVEVAAKGLFVRADEAELDGETGLYRLRGKPSVISRGSLRQEAREQVIRLADE